MTDFASMNFWDDATANSTNPICLEDILEEDLDAELMERRERKMQSDKKKRRRRRKKASEEDSSVADSMLSELLSEPEDEKVEVKGKGIPTVKEQIDNSKSGKQRRRERIEQLKAQKGVTTKNPVQPMRASLYPSSDEETTENPVVDDDDLSKNPFSDHNETTIDDDDLSKNPFSDHKKTAIADDDLSKNPFSDKIAKKNNSTNPFEDESVVSGDSDEDIIESSKRLLRCVDQRIQYQQQNDEVHSLKKEIKQLKLQAEAMAEQLRRAVETKCDLVLAQNEMERTHEQQQIAKDAEQRELRLYIQDILEQQAVAEVGFMNEIALLAGTIESDKKKHASAIEAKESKIFQLQTKIEAMKVESAQAASPEPFRTRFTNASGKSLFVYPSYE